MIKEKFIFLSSFCGNRVKSTAERLGDEQTLGGVK